METKKPKLRSGARRVVPETNWAVKLVDNINRGQKPPPQSPIKMAQVEDEIARLRAEGEIV